jgi:hypothetical protein
MRYMEPKYFGDLPPHLTCAYPQLYCIVMYIYCSMYNVHCIVYTDILIVTVIKENTVSFHFDIAMCMCILHQVLKTYSCTGKPNFNFLKKCMPRIRRPFMFISESHVPFPLVHVLFLELCERGELGRIEMKTVSPAFLRHCLMLQEGER